ncbi:MAG: response regulator [Rhodospirillaceae bacterium]|nr:response regulator [Rhodospirillaceae bacterium]
MIAAHGPHADVNLSRVGFLIVDDKPMSREMAHTALIGRARKVRQTMSVEKAAEILAQPDTDVECIVADWDMLPVGGLELLRMIRCRALPNVDPRTNFVIFTARAEEAAVKCAVELDVNGFAAAPLSLDKLARTIGAAVARTWNLQDIGHYASVPCVVPPPAPSQPIVSHTPATMAGASGRSPFGHVQAHGRRPAGVRMCGLNDVQPGLILARDIRDVHGTLLLRTGTALEAPIIDRLRKAAGAGAGRYQVWVRT